MISPLSPQDALVAVMMLVSAADREISDSEIREISAIIDVAPVFENFDKDRIQLVSASVLDLLKEEDGLETVIGLTKTALPDRLYETAYALACDIAAADGQIALEEMRLLEMIRHHFEIERLIAAGIERGARARHIRLPK